MVFDIHYPLNQQVKPETAILFRPVGPKELDLIAKSGFREFPPRLPEQPIFYPVLNEEYARQIAKDWMCQPAGQATWCALPCERTSLTATRSGQLAARFTRNCGFRPRNW